MEWLIGVLVVLAFLSWRLRRRSGNPAPLHAQVYIAPSGQHSVDFEGQPTEESLSLLALTYGAKIRWLLNHEPAETRELLSTLVEEAVGALGKNDGGSLLDALPTSEHLQSAKARAVRAAGGGEEYLVQMRRWPTGEAFVVNELPQPCHSFNIPWHYALLLSATADRLGDEAEVDLGVALEAARRFWEAENGLDTAALRSMIEKSNEAFRTKG